MAERFPDDCVDNERFSGSAAAWLAIILLFVLFSGVLGIVGYILTSGS